MAAAKIEGLQDMFRWEKRGLHAVLTYCPKVDTKIQKKKALANAKAFW